MTEPTPPKIRNLVRLIRDMQAEARDILHAIYEYEQGMPATGPPPDVERLITTIEMKTRTLLEFLNGERT